MSVYVETVRTYWQTYLPRATAQLPNPEAHFRKLAEQISVRVDQIATLLESEASMSPNEPTLPDDYLARVGTLNTMRAQAREMAFEEVLYSMPPESEQDDEELETSSRDRDLLTMQQEEAEVRRRLEMEPGSPEAIEWDRRRPHLIEEVNWMLEDHADLTEAQKREQLAEIMQRQDAARAQLAQ
ncbi:hypothetical protein [Nocardia thailandica]